MSSPLARAYANNGKWIADCPRPHCTSAELLLPWQPQFHCRSCHAEAPCEWPRDAPQLSEVLAGRGNPKWMNWFPAGHEMALRHGCPHGQSVTDLLGEDEEHASELQEWRSFGPATVTGILIPQLGWFQLPPSHVKHIE
jgi:hypothetical protein